MMRAADLSTRLAALPKAHLHVHLEGAARAATVAELATRHHRLMPDLHSFGDLAGFVDCYRQVTDLIRLPEDLTRIVAEFVADEADQGVLYSEPMIGPWLYADRFGWPIEDTFTFIDEVFQQTAHQHDVEVRYLLGVNWARPPDWIERAAGFAAEHADRNVVGIGFAGIEPADGFDRYSRACASARAHGLLVVPHLGETQGPPVIRAAVAVLRPQRIAHGVRAATDVDLLRDLAENRVVCDVCPSSNVRLGIVADLRRHPLPTLLRHGVPVTINADDPLLLAGTLTGEYVQVRDAFDLTDHQIADLAAAGLAAAGMTETTRARLRTTIRRWLTHAAAQRRQPRGGHHG